ncbi:ribonucleotide-diphosphate reductase subunit beta [Wohlfahrtiimonas sp. G9077]|uniref:ribonucleotide-diphosphate reductase subunit beta n=1 Tax=Wohlfahrtiimonas sp. G9077 TaxID=1980118 RepID=UPI000B98ED80|nr:ribonucleotide-diphosphate reductase subunit beta [Wohlfahrtiimonas sp. G9077]OYQ72572.1 response regulator SirA [Wohlfahrtiimonas sp. G9077]
MQESKPASIFNQDNSAWQTGRYPLVLGEALGLYDSVNVPYPKLFDLYKLQKSMDWTEDEVNLEQSRMDLLNCSKNNYDIMVKTLAFQWELDSVAARAIAPLFAPFVSNSELWAMLSKQSEVENLHALTYSEIIRQCISDPKEVFQEVMKNDEVLNRSTTVIETFNELSKYGALYKLGQVDKNDPKLKQVVLKGFVALYCLEKVEFMSSFACTFALAEQNIFQGIAKLVQKIAQDEQVHVMMDEAILEILLADEEWQVVLSEIRGDVENIIREVIEQEFSWNKYLFSENRSIVGLNETLLNEWVLYNAQDLYRFLGVDNPYPVIKTKPLVWMDNWLDLNKTQNANQESDNTNYRLNSVLDDSEDEIFDI